MIQIIDEGIVFTGVPGGSTNHCGFPGITVLSEGTLMSCWRVGSAKDSADGTIYVAHSFDQGKSWSQPFAPYSTMWNGTPGDLHACKFTDLGGGHLLACLMWFDRSDPSLPMFNPQTEGILPVKVLFSRSADNGHTWGPLWALDDSPYGATLAMTGPVVVLPDNRWLCQFEVNKTYHDPLPWQHQAAIKFSADEGRSWSPPTIVACDPNARIRYWDQRQALAPDGRCWAAFWTFDSASSSDLNITLSSSRDGGRTWSSPRDTGVPGQVPYPIILSDDRMLLLSVDRYQDPSIRARLIHLDECRVETNECIIYRHQTPAKDPGQSVDSNADHLQQQQHWTFGLPCGVADRAGDVWITYYNAGGDAAKIHWARLRC